MSHPSGASRSTREVSDSPTGLGWLLWTIAAALPWVQPFHGEPWAAFYSEALAAGVVVPVALWAVLRRPEPWSVQPMTAFLLALALVPIAQARSGQFVFPSEAGLIALYLTTFALTFWVARQVELIHPGRLAGALLSGLAIAALLSTALALYQWFEQDWLESVVHYRLISGRAYANVGQPNNLATLLAWGLVAIAWGHHRGRLGHGVAGLAAAFLLLGLVLTRSRTGWIEVALLSAAAIWWRWRHKTGPSFISVAALSAWFLALSIGLEPMASRMLREAPAVLSDQGAVGLRPTIWKLAVEEIQQKPLTGYGWNQNIPAYLTIADRHPDAHLIVNYTHNVVLDLFVWNGLPLGLVILSAMAWWVSIQWRGCRSQDQRLLLLALALLFVHAMLELPYTYLFFLVPASMMMGTLEAGVPARQLLAVPRWLVAALVFALGATLVAVVRDYQAIEADSQAARMRAAGIHNPRPAPPADPTILRHLQTGLTRMRIEPSRNLPPERLAEMRHALQRFPFVAGFARYARAAALSGRPDEAEWAMRRLCALNTVPTCKGAIRDWHERAAQGLPEMNAVRMPKPE